MQELVLRPYRSADEPAALRIIDSDRLAGQPAASAAMLRSALSGTSPVDSGHWEELTDLRTDVALEAGRLVGIISYAQRDRDDAGVILWAHGHEVEHVLHGLIKNSIMATCGRPTIVAFEMATALTVGLEALPKNHRRVTRRVLLGMGFTESDLWRYMVFDHACGAQNSALGTASSTTRIWNPTSEHDSWRLLVELDGHMVAEVEIGMPAPRIGAIWWVETDPAHRGRGFGRAAVHEALRKLGQLGAESTVLYVDDDETKPGDPRDRRAANRLYDSVGFAEVDRLLAFTAPTSQAMERLEGRQ